MKSIFKPFLLEFTFTCVCLVIGRQTALNANSNVNSLKLLVRLKLLVYSLCNVLVELV
ncbi:MAG: hypothetical protein LBP59_08800 [Planctomycetaceae bacterium]|nr:hypothetical protein [Planctomycetaceae bacterium]